MEPSRLKRFLLVSIIPQKMSDERILHNLQELKSLVESYGGEVVELVTQSRELDDKGMYIGRGKIEEIGEIIKGIKVDVIVLNAVLKASEVFDIKSALQKFQANLDVWDRTDLILNIFSRHAKTSEAKLQIEIAAMTHMGPRIYGMGYVLSRQGGGIGGRGIGETNTELMRRHWRDQMKKTKDKLAKLTKVREQQILNRQNQHLKTVSLVGYTNAGKTSLFNLLTKKGNYVKDELFATLDSAVGNLYLPESKTEVIVSDTIGFIQNIPTRLIDAFTSTLLESIHADVLLHVIDSTDPELYHKIDVVEEILFKLRLGNIKQIYVFNKIDLFKGDMQTLKDKYSQFSPHFISVTTKDGIDNLIQTIGKELN